jgi:glycosyltransferase involved in cell wall biosynthesis
VRILYLHRTQGQGVEGVHIRGITDAMRQAGHRVELVGPPGSDPYSPPPERDNSPGLSARFARHAPELLFELAEMAYDRRLYHRLVEIAERFEPDLIYERYAFFGGSGSCLATRLGIPHLLEINYTCDDPLVRRRSSMLKPAARRLETAIFRRARVLAPVSSLLAQRARDRGVNPDRIVITPNAVARDWWKAAATIRPAKLPEAFHGKLVMGFVGGFYPWHGLDRLVDAFVHCRDRGLRAALLLVGDGPERSRIEQKIAVAGLGDLTLLPGEIPHTELTPWLAAMDICVMPHSNDYGSPMKVFEYMALGKAVLAPDLPPLRDVINSGENGLLFGVNAGGGVPNLRSALANLLGADPERLAAMGAAARDAAGAKHTWGENLRRMLALADLQPEPTPAQTHRPELIGEPG